MVDDMARPVATEEERAEQRRKIRHAAAELHHEGGMRAVTVRAVAKRAGVSTGLLYSYYANLSDLMRTIWLGPIRDLGQQLAAVEANETEPLARIEGLLTTYVDFCVANEETHRGLLLFVRPPDSTTDQRNDPDELGLYGGLRRAIEAGQTAGVIRDGDSAAMAQLLWSGVHGALALPINTDTYVLTDGPTMATEMIDALSRSISR